MSRVPEFFVEATHAGAIDDPRVTDSQRDELRGDDAAIFAQHPPRAFVAEVERRSRAHGLLGGAAATSVSDIEDARERRLDAPSRAQFALGALGALTRAQLAFGALTRAQLAFGALGCATLATIALTVVVHAPEESAGVAHPQSSAGERAKGTARPQLEMHRVVDDKIETLANGDEARPGDVIQLAIAASEAKHAVVVSLDGRGEVTLHFPEDSAGSTAVSAHTTVALPHSFQLDDAPKFERFFLVTSEHEIDPRVVVDAARRLRGHADTAPLDVNFAQRSLLLRKVSP